MYRAHRRFIGHTWMLDNSDKRMKSHERLSIETDELKGLCSNYAKRSNRTEWTHHRLLDASTCLGRNNGPWRELRCRRNARRHDQNRTQLCSLKSHSAQ